MPRRKFDTTQRGISDTLTDAPIATSICENKLVYAERIRTLRAAANLSQGELAEAMNLGRAAISNWETGRTRPDIANIPRLCNVLASPLRRSSLTRQRKRAGTTPSVPSCGTIEN